MQKSKGDSQTFRFARLVLQMSTSLFYFFVILFAFFLRPFVTSTRCVPNVDYRGFNDPAAKNRTRPRIALPSPLATDEHVRLHERTSSETFPCHAAIPFRCTCRRVCRIQTAAAARASLLVLFARKRPDLNLAPLFNYIPSPIGGSVFRFHGLRRIDHREKV